MKRTGTLIGLVLAFALIAVVVVARYAWPTLASRVPRELPSEVAVDLPSAVMGENPVAMTNALAPCAAPGFPGGDLNQVPGWDEHVCLDEVGVAAASEAMAAGHEPGVLIFSEETTVSVFVSAEGDLYQQDPVFWPRLLGETRYFKVTLGAVVEITLPAGEWGLGPGQEGTCPAAGFAGIRKWSPGVCLGLYEADGGLVYAALEAAEMGEPGGTVYVRPGETVWGTVWISPDYMDAHGYPDRGAMFWPRIEGVEASAVIPVGVGTEVTLSGGDSGALYGLGHAPDPGDAALVVDPYVDPCLAEGLRQVPDWSVPICSNGPLIAGTDGRPGVVVGPISGAVLLIMSEGAQHGYTRGATLWGPGDPIEIPLDSKVPFDLTTGEWGLGPPADEQ